MKEINEKADKAGPLLRQMAAVEASMDGIAILDVEGKYIYLNRAHAEVYGYRSPEDLIGRSWKILYGDRELKRFEQEIMPAFFKKGKVIGSWDFDLAQERLFAALKEELERGGHA